MRVGVIGAGPAGLTAAYRLSQLGAEVTVFEAGDEVGGLARSIDLWGQRVDLGPHRFFTKDARINAVWNEVLGADHRIVQRRTRIHYRNRFFDYPLRVGNVVRNLGLSEISGSVASYARQRAFPDYPPDQRDTFEAWVVTHFGRRVYQMFFKSYSEKLWGIPCTQLDADFAAQRIRRFTLGQSILNAVGIGRGRHKTLVDEFSYPKGGSGALYRRMSERFVAQGGRLRLSTRVRRVLHAGPKVSGLELADGSTESFDDVVSTMPLTLLVQGLEQVPPSVHQAVARLRFRNTTLVYLKVEATDLFTDQWLYIHSDDVAVGRVTNFRNWVPELYGDQTATILAFEYWSYDDDAIWSEPDEALIARASEECARIGLVRPDIAISAGHVVRIRRCYPVYARGYRDILAPIVSYLRGFDRLWPIGRYGSFKYNNQDHSILMGLLVAENICAGTKHDLWSVNTDYDSYQEEASDSGNAGSR